MCACMCFQIILVIESLITHITNIKALTTTFVCIPYQTALATECLIKHISNIRALTTL